uniref:Uncharacterized protein n=1 Tax=Arundo donax TaxID=35708 RepID=A0A0A9GY51_ARUDO
MDSEKLLEKGLCIILVKDSLAVIIVPTYNSRDASIIKGCYCRPGITILCIQTTAI